MEALALAAVAIAALALVAWQTHVQARTIREQQRLCAELARGLLVHRGVPAVEASMIRDVEPALAPNAPPLSEQEWLPS